MGPLTGQGRVRLAGGIPGEVSGALEDVNVPCYAYDRHGVIRWLNPAARSVVGDARGKQFTTVVAPEMGRAARESFARKMLGMEGSSEHEVVVINADGERVAVEICSAPLREDQRIVGVFGIVTQQESTAPPPPHPKLTPRQNQILHLLARGHSTRQIAGELHLTVETVRNHVRHLLRALGAHSRLEALALARSDGLLAD
jgi:PAS domain S-box-containing protein